MIPTPEVALPSLPWSRFRISGSLGESAFPRNGGASSLEMVSTATLLPPSTAGLP